MEYYYLNKNAQPTGEHEIHKASCKFLPHMSNCIKLGYFYRAYDALIAAKNIIAMLMVAIIVLQKFTKSKNRGNYKIAPYNTKEVL